MIRVLNAAACQKDVNLICDRGQQEVVPKLKKKDHFLAILAVRVLLLQF